VQLSTRVLEMLAKTALKFLMVVERRFRNGRLYAARNAETYAFPSRKAKRRLAVYEATLCLLHSTGNYPGYGDLIRRLITAKDVEDCLWDRLRRPCRLRAGGGLRMCTSPRAPSPDLGSSCTHRIRPGRAMRHAYTDRVVSAWSTSQSKPSAASLPPRNSLAIRRPRDDPRSAATSVDTNMTYFSVPVTHFAQITYHANTHPPPP